MIVRSQHIALMTAAALALAAAAGAALAQPAASSAPATPAGSSAPAQPAEAVASGPVALSPPPGGKGQVVFYRKPMLSLIPFNWIVRDGKTELCEMVAGTYCVVPVDPGTHTFEVHSAEAKNDLTLEVDAGETYYVVGGISMGLIVNHPNISPAQKIKFDAISAKLKAREPIAAKPAT